MLGLRLPRSEEDIGHQARGLSAQVRVRVRVSVRVRVRVGVRVRVRVRFGVSVGFMWYTFGPVYAAWMRCPLRGVDPPEG